MSAESALYVFTASIYSTSGSFSIPDRAAVLILAWFFNSTTYISSYRTSCCLGADNVPYPFPLILDWTALNDFPGLSLTIYLFFTFFEAGSSTPALLAISTILSPASLSRLIFFAIASISFFNPAGATSADFLNKALIASCCLLLMTAVLLAPFSLRSSISGLISTK